MSASYPSMSQKDRLRAYSDLIKHPGWQLLKQSFLHDLLPAIQDSDSKERFLYEAIRHQAITEVFHSPYQFIQQVGKGNYGYTEELVSDLMEFDLYSDELLDDDELWLDDLN